MSTSTGLLVAQTSGVTTSDHGHRSPVALRARGTIGRDLPTHRASRPAPARLATVRGMGRGGVRLHRPERGRGPVRAEARSPVDLAPVGLAGNPARDCDDDIWGNLVLTAAYAANSASGTSRIGACVRGLRVRPQRNGRHGRVSGMRAAIRHRRRSSLVGAGAVAVAPQWPTA